MYLFNAEVINSVVAPLPLLRLDLLERTGLVLRSASMQLLMGMSAAGLPNAATAVRASACANAAHH